MVDNKKDPYCGMPVTAGITDTVHYKGKVYGFCSDECKQLFLKDPVDTCKECGNEIGIIRLERGTFSNRYINRFIHQLINS